MKYGYSRQAAFDSRTCSSIKYVTNNVYNNVKVNVRHNDTVTIHLYTRNLVPHFHPINQKILSYITLVNMGWGNIIDFMFFNKNGTRLWDETNYSSSNISVPQSIYSNKGAQLYLFFKIMDYMIMSLEFFINYYTSIYQKSRPTFSSHKPENTFLYNVSKHGMGKHH